MMSSQGIWATNLEKLSLIMQSPELINTTKRPLA